MIDYLLFGKIILTEFLDLCQFNKKMLLFYSVAHYNAYTSKKTFSVNNNSLISCV